MFNSNKLKTSNVLLCVITVTGPNTYSVRLKYNKQYIENTFDREGTGYDPFEKNT